MFWDSTNEIIILKYIIIKNIYYYKIFILNLKYKIYVIKYIFHILNSFVSINNLVYCNLIVIVKLIILIFNINSKRYK